MKTPEEPFPVGTVIGWWEQNYGVVRAPLMHGTYEVALLKNGRVVEVTPNPSFKRVIMSFAGPVPIPRKFTR